MNALEFHAGMKRHFRVTNAGRFMDRLILQISREPRIDVMAFDDWLHAQHGEYESDGLSMREAIAKHYSPEATAFIEGLI